MGGKVPQKARAEREFESGAERVCCALGMRMLIDLRSKAYLIALVLFGWALGAGRARRRGLCRVARAESTCAHKHARGRSAGNESTAILDLRSRIERID